MTDRTAAQTSEGGGAALPEGEGAEGSAHSPEPWRTYGDGLYVLDATGQTLTMALRDMSSVFRNDADARRIAACVNACAGMSTEALEAGALAKALRDTAALLVIGRDAGDVTAASAAATLERVKAIGDSLIAGLLTLGFLREPIPATPPPEHADAAPTTTSKAEDDR